MTDLKFILTHSPAIVTRKTGNEYVLVPVSDNIADMNSVYTLNETGAFIWDQIDGKKTVGDIIDTLMNEYETDRTVAETDVFDFIEKLNKYLIVI